MKGPKSKLMGWLEGLRFPVLLLITVVLLVANLLVPDALPFVDEVLMGLVAILLARVKRRPDKKGAAKQEDQGA